MPSEEDTSWVKRVSEMPLSPKPLGDYGALVRRMLESGLSEYEIARFAKLVSYEAIHYMCYNLDDPDASLQFTENDDLNCGLFKINDGRPEERIGGLHETIMELDPSKREMRPKAEDNPNHSRSVAK